MVSMTAPQTINDVAGKGVEIDDIGAYGVGAGEITAQHAFFAKAILERIPFARIVTDAGWAINRRLTKGGDDRPLAISTSRTPGNR
jgi:hypothetical protein